MALRGSLNRVGLPLGGAIMGVMYTNISVAGLLIVVALIKQSTGVEELAYLCCQNICLLYM